MHFLFRYRNEAYALMRIMSGLLFSFHGAQKLFGFLSDHQPPFPSQLWFGGVVELVGGILIMIGLFTRYAAFLASGQMAVAYFQFHWKFQMNNQIFPVVNRGELAAIYCFLFLFIAICGGVTWCLDKRELLFQPSAENHENSRDTTR